MPKLLTDTGLRFLWISAVVIALDLWSKYEIIGNMALSESVEIMPFFNFTYVRNYGAAFSFLHDASGWQRWFFTGIAVVVSTIILWWLKQSDKQQRLLPVALCFILGGAIGNVYDRLVHGFVIDFLDFYVGSWSWPAFNLADSAIFIGAALLVWDMLTNKDSNKSSEQTRAK